MPIVAPAVEIIPHSRDRREVLRQEGPRAPGGGQILDRVPDTAQVNPARTPQPVRAGQERAHDGPFRIRQIASVMGRRESRILFATRKRP